MVQSDVQYKIQYLSTQILETVVIFSSLSTAFTTYMKNPQILVDS